MDFRVAIKALLPMLICLLCASASLAERREIAFPVANGLFSGHPLAVAVRSDGQVGFALVANLQDFSGRLFSFSVTEGKVIDEFDLTPDFGAGTNGIPPTFWMKLHQETGMVAVYGTTSNRVQKVVTFASDASGHLFKRWQAVYLPANGLWPDMSFNRDGSRVCVVYTDKASGSPSRNVDDGESSQAGTGGMALIETVQRADLIRVEDGVVLATATLKEAGDFVWAVFDDVHNRFIALAGTSAHVFTNDQDGLRIEKAIGPVAGLSSLTDPAISQNGRFLIAYAAYDPGNRSNAFVSYDLELNTPRVLNINDDFFPVSGGLLPFHRPTGTLLVPLSGRWAEEDGKVTLSFTHSRKSYVIALASDGSLQHTVDAVLPRRSPGSDQGRNVIGPFNNAAMSPSGAIGFVSTHSLRLLSFDTLTGEIVNDVPLTSENRTFISYSNQAGLLLYSSGNKLVLEDVSVGPIISDVKVTSQQTIIKGANFLAGARVEINGADLGVVNRNPDNPGREIILDKGKRDFPAGQPFTIVVINRDGLRSKPFTFQR